MLKLLLNNFKLKMGIFIWWLNNFSLNFDGSLDKFKMHVVWSKIADVSFCRKFTNKFNKKISSYPI